MLIRGRDNSGVKELLLVPYLDSDLPSTGSFNLVQNGWPRKIKQMDLLSLSLSFCNVMWMH